MDFFGFVIGFMIVLGLAVCLAWFWDGGDWW